MAVVPMSLFLRLTMRRLTRAATVTRRKARDKRFCGSAKKTACAILGYR